MPTTTTGSMTLWRRMIFSTSDEARRGLLGGSILGDDQSPTGGQRGDQHSEVWQCAGGEIFLRAGGNCHNKGEDSEDGCFWVFHFFSPLISGSSYENRPY
jgi:hypothetical protein